MINEVFAISRLPERYTEVRQQRLRLLVGPGRRHHDDVHPSQLVYFVVADLGKDDLLLEPERIVPASVEGPGRHSLEVAQARKRDVHESIQELIHARAAQGDLAADGHIFPELEIGDRLLRPSHHWLLTGDGGEIAGCEVEHLRILLTFANAHVDDDLLEA